MLFLQHYHSESESSPLIVASSYRGGLHPQENATTHLLEKFKMRSPYPFLKLSPVLVLLFYHASFDTLSLRQKPTRPNCVSTVRGKVHHLGSGVFAVEQALWCIVRGSSAQLNLVPDNRCTCCDRLRRSSTYSSAGVSDRRLLPITPAF